VKLSEFFQRRVAILDDYPIREKGEPVYLPSGHGFRSIAEYHISVAVYLNIGGHLTGAIPAYLDPGHNQNFSISEEQLRWIGVDSNSLPHIGSMRFRDHRVPLKAADLVLCGNMKRTRELNPGRSFRFPFSKDRGILVHSQSIAPLPILGLRGILRNKLKLTFDGERMAVTLTT
jgi:hypothetical protein